MAHENGIGQRFLGILAGHVEDEVLVACGFELGDGVVQLGKVIAAHTENDARLRGDRAHLGKVLRVCAVEDGLAVLAQGQRLLGAVGAFAVEDERAVRGHCLLDKVFPLVGGVLLAVDKDEFDILALADTLVIDLLQVGQLLVGLRLVHAGADGNGEAVAGNEGLFMTEQDSLAAELDVTADGEGLHGRRGGLGQLCLGFLGEVRAFINGYRALRDLHAEGHTRGAAAFLTVLLGRELENIQTFQCHSCFLLPLRPALRSWSRWP